jgi:hypothetical protein
VAGFAIGGLGTGESPGQREAILQLAARELPRGKPRLVSGLGAPEEILAAVAQVGGGVLCCAALCCTVGCSALCMADKPGLGIMWLEGAGVVGRGQLKRVAIVLC